MNPINKLIIVFALPLLFFTQVAKAETFNGYVVELFTGSGPSATFQTALVGLSSSPTGAIQLYRFTSDTTYYATLRNARINQQVMGVQYEGGTVTGVHLYRP